MRDFKVSLKVITTAGKLVRWTGKVTSVPGHDIFATAREHFRHVAKRGTIARTVRATAF